MVSGASAAIKPLPKWPAKSVAQQPRPSRVLPLKPVTLTDLVARIGASGRIAVVSFTPAYPIDLGRIKGLDGNPARAAAQVADAIDGHVELRSPTLLLIEPNFRVDSPSTPLVPRVRAVVRGTYGLAQAFGDLSPQLQSAAMGRPAGIPISAIQPDALADMNRLALEGRPFNLAIFGGAIVKNRSLSFRPELLVNVHCGGVRLGSFDEWEQRDNDSIGWDYNSAIDPAALNAPDPPNGPEAAAFDETGGVAIKPSSRYLTLSQGRLALSDLPAALLSSGVRLIVDSKIASQSVTVSSGVFESGALLDSVRRCLQLDAYPIASRDPATPRYLLTGPEPQSDQQAADSAVDRQIAYTWAPVCQAVAGARPAGLSPFPVAGFATFANLRYRELDAAQRACVDRLLDLLSVHLTDEQRARITVSLRPGLIAQGRVNGELASTIEESAALHADANQ